MRILPILMAIAVAVILYFTIIGAPDTSQNDMAASQKEATTEASSGEDTLTKKSLIKVSARHSQAQSINSAVILRGQTEAARQVQVRAETSSTVVSAPIPKGSLVQEGQLLCKLDPGVRGASLAEAKARLSESKARLEEARNRVPESVARVTEATARLDEAMVNQNAATKLSKGGFATDTRVKSANAAVAAAQSGVAAANSGLSAATSGIQSAEAGIEAATANVSAAEKEIARLEIRAPFSGILESDTAELGSLLQPGSLCATVIQLDVIKLVAFAPETEVNRIELNAPAGGRLATGGVQIEGNVSFISRSADKTTRTFRVEIEIPNPDLKISDGQTAEVMIAAEGASAHLLPQSALTLNNDGVLGIRTVDADHIVQFMPVELLRDTTKGVWLTGLPEKLDVIVLGQEYVTSGVKVEPHFEEPNQ